MLRSEPCQVPRLLLTLPAGGSFPRLQSGYAPFSCLPRETGSLVYLGLTLTLAGSGACFVSEKLLKTFFFNHCGLRAKKPIYSAYFTKGMLYGRQYWRCWEPSKGEHCPGEGVLTVYITASLPGSLYGLASRNQQFG